MEDKLIIGGKEINNRLFIGTGKFADKSIIYDVLKSSEAQVVTVAVRRIDEKSKDENVLKFIPEGCILMPNTSGARDAEEAARIARLARAAGAGNWIKIEIISDNKYLLPDNKETIKATEILAKEGFVVLPYMMPDLYDAKRMCDAGASAIMPLGSPIGSTRGVKTEEIVKILIDEIALPIIVDAGIGRPSEAAYCMELGCSAVLVNTAIAISEEPVNSAIAFSLAVKAGRLAFLSGLQDNSTHFSSASSPLTGFLHKRGE